jgi:hypothetical protein
MENKIYVFCNMCYRDEKYILFTTLTTRVHLVGRAVLKVP